MSIPIPPNLPPATDVPKKGPALTKMPRTGTYAIEPYRQVAVTDEEDPYGAFHRFYQLFSRLRVQWNREEPHNVTSTLRNRAEMLDWDPRSLKVVEGVTGLMTSIPRRCPGRVTQSKLKSCPDPNTQTCPCSFLHGNDPDVWKGRLCPGESVKAYQHFVRYIRELGVRENDHVDIGMVVDLVQLHLIEDRCTENIQIQGLFQDKTGVVSQKTGEVHYDRTVSVAVGVKEASQKQRMKLFEALQADRREREKLRAQSVKERQEDKKSDVFTNISDIMSTAWTLRPETPTLTLDPENDDFLDASFEDEPYHETED